MSNFQVTPITGLPQVNGWAQVVTHPSRLLHCVLAVSGKNANSVGKTLAEQITHFQVTDSAQLHNALLDVLQNARAENCRLELACLLFAEQKSILASSGGSVFLKRNQRAGEILTSAGELKIIEGSHQPDDVFILATQQVDQVFPDLKDQLLQPTEDLAPKLVADLHGGENSSLSALAWIESQPESDSDVASLVNVSGKSSFATKLNLGGIWQNGRQLFANFMEKKPWLSIRPATEKFLAKFGRGSQSNTNGVLGPRPRLAPKQFLLIAGAVVLLLIALIFLKQRQINAEIQTLQPRFGELQQQLANAKNLASTEPITARAETRAVLQGLEELIAGNQDKKDALKKLREEYQSAQEFSETIAGTETQGPLEAFFDLRLTEAGFVAKELAMSGTTLLALDAAGQRAALLDTTNKQTQQIVFDNIGTAKAIATDDEQLYVLADGLHSYELSENHSHEQLKEPGDSDRAGTLLENFTSYLYVLNPEERNLYRYLQGDDGLSDPIGWLTDKQGLEFSQITSMSIDGDVWLTTQTGQVFKYTQGSRQNFTISGLATPFDSPLKIATNPDSEYLLVLEKNRQRLVVLRKDGGFLKEIVSESLASTETLVSSPTENAAYVVSGSLVYKIAY